MSNSTFHVLDLPIRWSRGFDPLGWLTANTTDHVCMSEGLRSWSVVGLGDGRWKRLGNARVEGRCPAWDDVCVNNLLAGTRTIGIASSWTGDTRGEGGTS